MSNLRAEIIDSDKIITIDLQVTTINGINIKKILPCCSCTCDDTDTNICNPCYDVHCDENNNECSCECHGEKTTYDELNRVAIGNLSGTFSQGANAVAIGANSGQNNQGYNSVAVGYLAGQSNQHSNSIALNASGIPLNPNQSGLFVNPIRGVDHGIGVGILKYDPGSNEITYSTT